MTDQNAKGWRLNRQINLSVIMQLVLLASLIVGAETRIALDQKHRARIPPAVD